MQQVQESGSHYRSNDQELEILEQIILAALYIRDPFSGQIVDVAKLHEDCWGVGYTSRDVSKGLVQLLMRNYLRPCGDFVFAMTEEGRRAGAEALSTNYWNN